MGVLIFEGMKVEFQSGDLTISVDEDGNTSSQAILSTSYNTLPIWLKLAKDNCAEAELFNKKIQSGWPSDPEDQKQLLLSELRPSILSIVACAIAIDGLYGLVKPFAKLDARTLKGWQKNGKSRAFRIAEVFRRVFLLNRAETAGTRELVKEITDLRDKAVHPSHAIERSVVRPDVPVGLDWRFVAYRHTNCETAFQNTLRMFNEYFQRPSVDEKVANEMAILEKAFRENGLTCEK